MKESRRIVQTGLWGDVGSIQEQGVGGIASKWARGPSVT